MEPPSHSSVFELVLVGHLSLASLEAALARDLAEVPFDRQSLLLVDCMAMNDYDVAARTLFTSWMAHNRHLFRCVAVITRNKLWHFVVATMSLASGMPLKAFDERAQGHNWLRTESARLAARRPQ